MDYAQGLCVQEPAGTYGTNDRGEVWTRGQATKALRDMVGRQGFVPAEYALHSGRIRGATRLGAPGLQSWAIRKEGRRKGDAFIMYVSASREDKERVSQVLEYIAMAGGIQPGQGTT